ncbi:MAG: hypothetical protein EOO19_08970, partial [Chryseobacterium sp.]
MKKILLFGFVFLNAICFSQKIKVSGESFRPFKYDIMVVNAFNEKYYNGNQTRDSAAVENGKFGFNIPIKII